METSSDARQIIKKLVPPLALWLTSRLLETPKVKGALAEVDSYTFIGKRMGSRVAKRAGKNMKRNPAWLAASAAAFAIAIGCLAKAGQSKR